MQRRQGTEKASAAEQHFKPFSATQSSSMLKHN